MASYTAITILLVGLLVGCTLGQRQNYVDENYEYEEAPLPPPRAAPRANSRPSFSSQSAAPRPTPVPILKQINRHNDDGSYTYGYEGADGSFKIETKLPTGEVMGKYGYVDDVGKVRVVEYGANRYGFQPAGEGITVAPPTLVDESTTKKGQQPLYVDDGQYYEDEEPLPPRPRPAGKAAPRPHPRPAPVPAPRFAPAPQPIYDTEIRSAPRPAARPASPPSRPSFTNAAPAPPRPSFTNAAPAPPRPVFANAPSASVPHRAPPQQAPRYQQPVFQPAPVYEDVPAPRPTHQQHHYPRPAQGGGGILDQLEKDYALPQSSGTYADVRFGSL